MSLWLIRTHRNELLGPVSREELITQIREGQVTVEDEICASNHYWIHLDERDEVASQLGIEIPRAKRRDGEEITLTDTAELDYSPGDLSPAPKNENASAASFSQSAQSSHSLASESASAPVAASSSSRARTRNRHRSPVVVGRPETAFLLRVGTFVLVLITSGFVFWILKILREATELAPRK
jgi:hypothetical protein